MSSQRHLLVGITLTLSNPSSSDSHNSRGDIVFPNLQAVPNNATLLLLDVIAFDGHSIHDGAGGSRCPSNVTISATFSRNPFSVG
jgi:hypothetical protein